MISPSIKVRTPVDKEDFTPRELQVLNLMSHGKNATVISKELGISFFTMHSHLRNMYAKTGVHTQHKLVAVAFMDGIVH